VASDKNVLEPKWSLTGGVSESSGLKN